MVDWGKAKVPNERTVEIHRLESKELYMEVVRLFDENGLRGTGET